MSRHYLGDEVVDGLMKGALMQVQGALEQSLRDQNVDEAS